MPARTRAGLDRAAVVRAAAALADAEGYEAVTLARLAGELGVRPPSLYNHVEGLDGLRRELALAGLQELGRRLSRATVGKSEDAALAALADAYRRFARDRPGLYPATLRAPDPEDAELNAAGEEALAVILAVLAGYGLQGADALHATRGLRSLLHGFVSLEAAGGFGLPLDLDESYCRLVASFITGLRTPAGVDEVDGVS
jgi:AcrR family transcriptional regulator